MPKRKAPNLNALARDSSIEAWQQTGLPFWAAQRMAYMELAAQGLGALTRVLSNNEAARLGDDPEAPGGALGDNHTAGLHAAAEALAIFSQRELEAIRDVLANEHQVARGTGAG